MAVRRGKGEGSIFEQKKTRKDGSIYSRWCAEVVTGYDKYNDKIVKRVYGDSKQDVIEKKNLLLSEKQKGLLPTTNSITVDMYIEHWLHLKKNTVKIKTYESYNQLYNLYIKDNLGKTKLQKLSTAQLNLFFNKLSTTEKKKDKEKTLSSNTLRRVKAVLSNMISTAISERIISINPLSNIQKIKRDNSFEIAILSEDEIKVLLSTAKEWYEKKGKSHLHTYHVTLLALATGMRRGEILGLKWDNVDTKNNTITIKQTLLETPGKPTFGTPKSEASKRTIAVHPNIIQELLERKDINDLVFHTASGLPVTPSNFSRAFRLIVKQCKLDHVRFHDLRHTHATQLLNKGVNIKQISERLGHENITITLQIYSHFMPVQDRQAAEIIGDILGIPNKNTNPAK